MKYTRYLEKVPAGFALNNAKAGEQVKIQTKGFVSSEDGDLFISRLEMVEEFLNTPSGKIPPSQIDSLLVVIHNDQNADVYINEIKIIGTAIPKKDLSLGEEVTTGDIAGIKKIEFEDCKISEQDGVLFLFSFRWRKALFFDFACIIKDKPPRDYDLNYALGTYYEYILFNERFKLLHNIWDKLLVNGLFPFIYLTEDTIKKIVQCVTMEWSLDHIITEIKEKLISDKENITRSFKRKEYLNNQLDFIDIGFKHLENADYISCIAVIYPRIEGLLRNILFDLHPESKTASQNDQANIITEIYDSPFGILFPDRFKTYLIEFYFQKFDPKNPIRLSRNTIGHGVARKEDFNELGAVIGILILIQINYYVQNEEKI